MKFSSTIIFLFLIFVGCNSSEDSDDRNIITVSILPQKYFTEEISGEDYEINVLIPPGASPVSYEPSPKQLQNLSKSDIYLKMGELVFEKAWIDQFLRRNPQIPARNVSAGIDLITSAHSHEGDKHEGADPHIWMSPKNALQISKNILHALIGTYPEDSINFHSNYQELRKEILEIDSLYRLSSAKLKAKEFLIYHPALAYLARDYGMVQHVLEFEGKEPPPSYIASLIDLAKKKNIKTVFVQKQFSLDNARSLAKEINARILVIDPLSENWPDEMKKILQFLTD